ncbi:MAG: nicotinate-nucleotide adenylyltransferase [Vulcanibacillus sp.]
MKKIGIIGGTYDPIHIGHLIAADQVLFYQKLDEIWFMPANNPPHKLNLNITSYEHRVEMLNHVLILDSRYKICTIEMERIGPSYTIDTIKELKVRYPQDSFYFIIGGDMIRDLAKWYKIEELIKLVQFIGLERIGYTDKTLTEQEKQIINRVIMVPMPQLEVSSSLIRDWVKMGRDIRYVVLEGVEHYIKENKLYGDWN